MKLYHGTSSEFLPDILKHGILPRLKRKGNWKKSIASNPSAVYLSESYAMFYAVQATRDGFSPVVIEVDTDRLDQSRLAPDEDFLEQATRGQHGRPVSASSIVKAQRQFRDTLRLHSHLWTKSVEFLGTCAYFGTIPVSAITRYATCSISSPAVINAFDTTVSLLNYKLCSHVYKAMTRWLFGAEIKPEDLDTVPIADVQTDAELPEEFNAFIRFQRERYEFVSRWLSERDGVTVVDLELLLQGG